MVIAAIILEVMDAFEWLSMICFLQFCKSANLQFCNFAIFHCLNLCCKAKTNLSKYESFWYYWNHHEILGKVDVLKAQNNAVMKIINLVKNEAEFYLTQWGPLYHT